MLYFDEGEAKREGCSLVTDKFLWRRPLLASRRARVPLRTGELLARERRKLAENLGGVVLGETGLFSGERPFVAAFSPYRSEPDITSFLDELVDLGAEVLLPDLVGNLPRWKDSSGRSANTVLPKVSAIVLPGLAFDGAGTRLGRGAGWYDRALLDLSPTTVRIGVCFASEFVTGPVLPRDAHDQPVNWVVTPEFSTRVS